jgi:hypothetical protein
MGIAMHELIFFFACQSSDCRIVKCGVERPVVVTLADLWMAQTSKEDKIQTYALVQSDEDWKSTENVGKGLRNQKTQSTMLCC